MDVFKLFSPAVNTDKHILKDFLTTLYRMVMSTKFQTYKLKPNKVSGHDLIRGKMLRKLSSKDVMFLIAVYNGMLRLSYRSILYKLAEIIIVPKSNKLSHNIIVQIYQSALNNG